MKIYRVSYRDEYSEHKGYRYYQNKSAANREQKNDNNDRGDCGFKDEIEELEIELTQKGILKFLNIHASYSDNG